MDVDAQMAESNQILKEEADGLKNLPKGTSGDYFAHALNFEWEYDFFNNKGDTVNVQKAQYAYYKWNEEWKESQVNVGNTKADISVLLSGVYQIFGFYSVFQGVVYQGVTAMSSSLICVFYRIPVIMSVLASAATILGIYMQLSSVLDKIDILHRNITQGMDGALAAMAKSLQHHKTVTMALSRFAPKSCSSE